jgi:hypothetical protein
VKFAATGDDERPPFADLLGPRDAGIAAGVVAAFSSVLKVLGARRFTQIVDSVPRLDTVNMIDLMLGPMAIGEREDDAMRQQIAHLAIKGEGDVETALLSEAPAALPAKRVFHHFGMSARKRHLAPLSVSGARMKRSRKSASGMSMSLALGTALSVSASVRGRREKPGREFRRVGDQPIPRRLQL